MSFYPPPEPDDRLAAVMAAILSEGQTDRPKAASPRPAVPARGIVSRDVELAYDALVSDVEPNDANALAVAVDACSALGKGGNLVDGMHRLTSALELLASTIADGDRNRGAKRLAGAYVAARLELEKRL